MAKTDLHIEIVSSSISTLSSMSERSRLAIQDTLSQHFSRVGITLVDSVSDLEKLADKKPDLVFLGMKFVPAHIELGRQDPHKIWVADFLDEHGIIYTGSCAVAHNLELHKELAKQTVLNAGLHTPLFYTAKHGLPPAKNSFKLNFPVFIKPTNRGGGLGIDNDSLAHTFEELQAKVASISSQLHSDSLIEEFLPGREFSVAVLKNTDDAEYVAMPIEIIVKPNAQGARVLSEEVKSSDTEVIEPVTEASLRSSITELALRSFTALGARDYGRIDIRLNAQGIPYFLEANLIPSLINRYGNFPKACNLNKNIDYESMLLHIVQLALDHKPTIHTT